MVFLSARKHVLTLLVAFLVCVGGGCPTPTPILTGTVAGYVRDLSSESGVPGTTVTIGDKSAQTAADGSYMVSSIPTGTRALSVTKDGYSIVGTLPSVTIGANSTTNVPDVWMLPNTGPGSPPPPPSPGELILMFADDFDAESTGGHPSHWEVHEQSPPATDISVDDAVYRGQGGKSVRFVDSSSSQGCWISRACVEPYQSAVIQWHQRCAGTTNGRVALEISDFQQGYGAIVMSNEGSFEYQDSTGPHVAQSYELGQWYSIRLEIDIATQTFDLYIDDVLKVSDASFATSLSALASISFSTGGNAQCPNGVWIDDFAEYKRP